MATPGYSFFDLTSDGFINATTHGYFWALGPDRTVDWAVSGGLNGEFWSNPADVAGGIGNILSTFSYVADIKFNYLGSFATPSVAANNGAEIDISLSAFGMFPGPNVWARAFFNPNGIPYTGAVGDVFLNMSSPANFLPSYQPGTTGWALFIHELGHALGLKHPHDNGGTGRPLLGSLGLAELDHDWGTIMSYNDDYNWNLLAWHPITPMILDVIALQYLYGQNTATNAGDSVLQLERINAYGTLWDASGNDTVSAAGRPEGWLIQLPDVQPSPLVSTLAGLAAPTSDYALPAPTTLYWLAGTIENALGSSFADVIGGSRGANRLTGGLGDDYLDGGAGIDVATFNGSIGQYTLERTATGVIVRGPDGTDTITGVERLQVGSTKVAIDIDGNGGMSYRIYQAAFDRTPDLGGVSYWLGRMDGGMSLYDVAANFIASPEFQSTYGPLNNNQFAAQLYRNVLHRESDAGGLAFWTQALDSGNMTKPHVLASFSESPENQANLMGVLEYGFIYV